MRHRVEQRETSSTSLRIRTHCVLGANGVRSIALRVFCPRRGATTAVDVCERCPRQEAIDARGDCPSVTCYPGSESSGHESVGALVRSAVLCVLPALPLDELRPGDAAAHVIPVVDGSHRYIGVIVQGRSSSMPPPPESAAEVLGGRATVQDAIEYAPAVNERADVVMAAAAMTSSRSRCVPVVNDEGVFVGLLDDVSLLASVARAHAASEVTKVCSCGRVYSRRQWSELPRVGSMIGNDGGAIELRTCAVCGSTIAVPQRRASSSLG